MILAGVDIGTNGTKAALFDESGQLVAEAFESSELERPAPGVVEEDPERQFGSVCRTIKECIERSRLDSSEIAAVAIDGQMAGIIGVGEEGRAVTPYDSWLDTRCATQIEAMSREAGDEVTSKTGCPPSFNHGPKILWWKEEHPEAFKTVASFVQPGGYAAMRLCDLRASSAFLDTTYLHFSGFADNARSRWDHSLCDAFGVPESKLPRIVPPTEVVGGVSSEAAAASGMREATPVVAGCGDTAASFLSCGATRAGICVDVAGTASVFAATTAQFAPDLEAKILGCGQAVTEGLWHPYAYINGGGLNLTWFAELATSLRGEERSIELGELESLAAETADPALLPHFVPHFGGRVMPAMPRLRGAWVGLDWSHRAGELYRAILESVAFEYAIYLDALHALYPEQEVREIRITGGGQQSALWNRIKATTLGVQVTPIQGGAGAPMGAALLAGYGVGVFDDLPAAADRWVSVDQAIAPERQLADAYRKRTLEYRQLVSLLNRYHNP